VANLVDDVVQHERRLRRVALAAAVQVALGVPVRLLGAGRLGVPAVEGDLALGAGDAVIQPRAVQPAVERERHVQADQVVRARVDRHDTAAVRQRQQRVPPARGAP